MFIYTTALKHLVFGMGSCGKINHMYTFIIQVYIQGSLKTEAIDKQITGNQRVPVGL